ncbi:hypothetical protein [Candidatus Nucleicultrix amoebiphila]|uniref:Uncharacterized protein n=1 Tax=Candidatus Nucleicultrix amoebiphila FS5 TaxID=1414854 RepID=A0A1W6N5R6_9PROT|nr:hypothetical protein [Candidatus Nucleicultrix amoebiphila]ARN85220.1 hypothetical protein GQ61_07905 [Candidatus Nucleicultrix amoebiphila FS5]
MTKMKAFIEMIFLKSVNFIGRKTNMTKINNIFKSLVLTIALVSYGHCVNAYAKEDFKKYIPQEYRHYVPDTDGFKSEEFDFDEDFDFSDNEDLEKKEKNNPRSSQVDYGPRSYSHRSFDDLKIYGPATLENIIVKSNISVYGPLSGHKIQTKSLNVQGPLKIVDLKADTVEVNGPVSLTKALVTSDIIINGPLNAKNSEFKGTIDIATNKMRLIDSIGETILIRKNSKLHQKTQVVFLEGKTVIHKNISFEQGKGVVVLGKHVVLKGKVIGGKIKTQIDR